jgi:hypothetical protein
VAAKADRADQNGRHRAHDGCCSVCSVLLTAAPLDVPQTAAIIRFDRQSAGVVWLDFSPLLFGSRFGSPAQARAPPLLT